MRGPGSSIYPRNVAYDQISEVHWVAPQEAVWTCRQLAASHYAAGGWSVGAEVTRWTRCTTVIDPLTLPSAEQPAVEETRAADSDTSEEGR
jgi:cysteine synthase